MTKEDKNILLKVLSEQLSYGVICYTKKGDGYLCSINQTIFGTEYGININPLKRDYFSDSETEEQVIKPYLRPLSSMTKKEKKEVDASFSPTGQELFSLPYVDWLNAHHFDYRGWVLLFKQKKECIKLNEI